MIKNIKRVLIANRGEIAVRIIRALRDLDIESVAVYSEADADSLHVRLADYAFALKGVTSADSYLNIDQLKTAILASKADAIHPGYGFLSESNLFREMVASLKGVRFIGPSLEAMQQMGDKVEARRLMMQNQVPMVPGLDRPLKSAEDLLSVSQDLGFPLILKAAAGGGGRGMRIVRSESELAPAFEACTREAQSYFGNPAVFCERYIEKPRHIEFQVLFDEHGNGVHLFERDCSVQRRHQKLFEEAPSAYLNEEQRARLGEIAVRAGKACKYSGAGTVEFICESPDKAYFMEMNTRIQVEHPVTEQITDMDLIAMMVRVADGQKLPVEQKDIHLQGWSLEARINAEDPEKGFLPAPGKIKRLRIPLGPGVRVDTHLYEGYEIPSFYDSMVAKLIVHGSDRADAMAKMRRALAEFEVSGVPTTIKFHEALLKNDVFLSGDFTTRFLEEQEDFFKKAYQDDKTHQLDHELIAAICAALKAYQSNCDGGAKMVDFGSSRKLWKTKADFEATRKD